MDTHPRSITTPVLGAAATVVEILEVFSGKEFDRT